LLLAIIKGLMIYLGMGHRQQKTVISFSDRFVDVTKGNIWTVIWQLSWPMLLIMLFNFLVGLTDVYVAGFISSDVQAAVGFVTQIYFLIVVVANAITVGTLALISREIGAGEIGKAVDIAKQSLYLSSLVSIFLTAFCLMFSSEIVSLAGFPSRIADKADVFIKIFAFAIGPNYLLIVSNTIFRAGAEVNKPLTTMSIICIMNIILDFLLVFGLSPLPGFGYTGIALATASSTIMGTCINFLFLYKSRLWRLVYAPPRSWYPDTIKTIMKIGWPAALLQITWNVASLVLYNILGRLRELSIASIASLANGLRIEAIIYLPAFALNMAASVIVGQNLGAGDAKRAETMIWKLAMAGIGITSLISVVIFIWAERFAAFLTGDPAVLAETTRYLRLNMLSEPFMALSTVMGGALQGAGDTKAPMWVILITMWVIRLPLASYLALFADHGAGGVWVAMVISMTGQGLIMAWWFHQGKWKTLKLQ
jgi:multidrug resistance protein, MATE family